VIFDFGEVLVPWDYHKAFASLPAAEVERFDQEFDFLRFNAQMDAGRSYSEALAELGAQNPQWVTMVETYVANYPATLGPPTEGSYDLVAELKTAGYRLYGLTNWWSETFPCAHQAIPAIRMMDGIVVSGDEKVAKPDEEIFRILCERYAIEPAQAVFIDDNANNVAGGATYGFHTVHFTDVPSTRRALVDLGVKVKLPSEACANPRTG
jgi:2-haloacid dehalogenase